MLSWSFIWIWYYRHYTVLDDEFYVSACPIKMVSDGRFIMWLVESTIHTFCLGIPHKTPRKVATKREKIWDNIKIRLDPLYYLFKTIWFRHFWIFEILMAADPIWQPSKKGIFAWEKTNKSSLFLPNSNTSLNFN